MALTPKSYKEFLEEVKSVFANRYGLQIVVAGNSPDDGMALRDAVLSIRKENAATDAIISYLSDAIAGTIVAVFRAMPRQESTHVVTSEVYAGLPIGLIQELLADHLNTLWHGWHRKDHECALAWFGGILTKIRSPRAAASFMWKHTLGALELIWENWLPSAPPVILDHDVIGHLRAVTHLVVLLWLENQRDSYDELFASFSYDNECTAICTCCAYSGEDFLVIGGEEENKNTMEEERKDNCSHPQ